MSCQRINWPWILLLWKDQLYLNLDPVVSKDQLYLDPVVSEDQLYLDPVVGKVQYLEMMQWLEGPGSDALYPVVGEVNLLQLVEAGQRFLAQASQPIQAQVKEPASHPEAVKLSLLRILIRIRIH